MAAHAPLWTPYTPCYTDTPYKPYHTPRICNDDFEAYHEMLKIYIVLPEKAGSQVYSREASRLDAKQSNTALHLQDEEAGHIPAWHTQQSRPAQEAPYRAIEPVSFGIAPSNASCVLWPEASENLWQ